MSNHQFMKRFYKPREFKRLLADLMSSVCDTRRWPKDQRISRQFSERIIMAVTEVNGCRYCSYFHTQVSLHAGMKKDEIHRILEGDFVDAPQEELPALNFAQHYADSGGQPNTESVQFLEDVYGIDRAKEIVANIRAIMIGNALGNGFDALRTRFAGNPAPNSSFWEELGVIFGPFVMIPTILVGRLFHQIGQPAASVN